jgi:hypothetical protein
VRVVAFVLVLAGCSHPCGPANCGGCCDATGTCVDGTVASACGQDGGTCSACDSSLRCVKNSCGMPLCTTANCSGCCDSSDICEQGAQDFACGIGGAVCQGCPVNHFCRSGQCM